jgi:hypothetical protein
VLQAARAYLDSDGAGKRRPEVESGLPTRKE